MFNYGVTFSIPSNVYLKFLITVELRLNVQDYVYPFPNASPLIGLKVTKYAILFRNKTFAMTQMRMNVWFSSESMIKSKHAKVCNHSLQYISSLANFKCAIIEKHRVVNDLLFLVRCLQTER